MRAINKKNFRKKPRKKGPVVSRKVKYDGITFASGLEKYMYIALKKAKIVDAATFGRNSPRGSSPRGRSTSPRNPANTGGD